MAKSIPILNKHSTIAIFVAKGDISSLQLQIILTEKGVSYETYYEDPNNPSEELLTYNPYGTLPVLIDNDLVLFNTPIIMEYLDERYPFPPLMPVYPVIRAEIRLYIYRIEKEWFTDFFKATTAENFDLKTLESIRDDIIEIADIFKEEEYFHTDSFSLLDCYIAPLIWYLKYKYEIPFTGLKAKPINSYIKKFLEKPNVLKIIDGEEF